MIKALEERLHDVDAKIQTKQPELATAQSQATNTDAGLKELIDFRKSLSQRIEIEKTDQELPGKLIAQIIDTAKPSNTRVGYTRPLGTVALLIGLIVSGLGVWFLRQPLTMNP